MKLAVLSDVHGNWKALQAVLAHMEEKNIDGVALLGDLIDYGPHSNEVIQQIAELELPIVCNIWGNHEEAVIEQHYERFSSARGQRSAQKTLKDLTPESRDYIENHMNRQGYQIFMIEEKKCLAVHGSMEDCFWKSITPSIDAEAYKKFDYVFSGHSHEPHFFEKYNPVRREATRNRKKTIFLNPGSVGQPRNLNHRAQYAVLDTETEECYLYKVNYDIEAEMQCFSEETDAFYRERLKGGI